MRKKIFLGIVTVLFAWWLWPIVDPHLDQDRCSFGSVSNEEYRALLKETKELVANKWTILRAKSGRDEHLKSPSKLLTSRIREFWERQDSVDGKIAAMHAVLRAHGMIYYYASHERLRPESTHRKYNLADMTYYYKRHNFFIFPFSFRELIGTFFGLKWAMIDIFMEKNEKVFIIEKTVIHSIDLFDPPRQFKSDGQNCPSVDVPQ